MHNKAKLYMPSRDAGISLHRRGSDEDARFEIDPDVVNVPTDFSDIVRQEFGFRSKPRDKYVAKTALASRAEDEAVALVPQDKTEDGDYAPKSRGGVKRKRTAKSKKKKAGPNVHVSDDEQSMDPDMQAYFDKKAPRTDEDGNDLFCICRKGDLGKWMIGCDGCDEWYHGDCIDVSKFDEGLIDQYFCPRCQRDGEGTTIWKRKCRLKGCRKPALDGPKPSKQDEDVVMGGTDEAAVVKQSQSKYCSAEHGLEYFRQQVAQALIPKPQIKSMILAVSNVSDFKKMGDIAPTIEGQGSASDVAKLTNMSDERQEIYAELVRLEARIQCLNQMRERSVRINASIKARKEKEICGLDERLNLQDADFDTLIASPAFMESLIRGTETEKMCTMPLKKCSKHAGWYSIRADGYRLEESLLKERLAELRREDHEVRLAAKRRIID